MSKRPGASTKVRTSLREHLVDAAYRLIDAGKAGDRLTARLVIEEARYKSPGTLTAQFRKMEDLRAAVAIRALGELVSVVQQAHGGGDPPVDRLKAMAQACVRWVLEHSSLYRLLMADAYVGHPEIAEGRERLFRLVGDQVVRVQASGHLPAGDPNGPAQLVISVVWGMMQQAVDRGHSVRQASDDVAAAIDRLLAPTPRK